MFQHGESVHSSTCQVFQKNVIFRGCKEIAYIVTALYDQRSLTDRVLEEQLILTQFSNEQFNKHLLGDYYASGSLPARGKQRCLGQKPFAPVVSWGIWATTQ